MVKEEEEEKKTKVPQGVKKDETPKISDAFKKMTKVDPQGKKQSDYDRKLLEFLASQFVPFYVVDSGEFKAFVEELYKTINLKCSRTYSRQMEELAIEVLAEVKKAVEEYCKWSCAITTDLWTSRARDSYISVTLHFVDKLFRLHRFLSVCFSVDNEKEKVNNTSDHNIDSNDLITLSRGTPFCSPFVGRHGGENIASVLDVDLQQKLHLEEKMPKWGVSDNASNMVRGIGMSVLELYTCNCHTQLLRIVSRVFETMARMKQCWTR